MDGVDPGPGAGRVGPPARQGDLHPDGPLTAGLHQAAGGLGQNGGVGGQDLRSLGHEVMEAVVSPFDLFTGVKEVGGVDHGLGDGESQVEEDGQPPLHVDGAQPGDGVTRHLVTVRTEGRDRIQMSGQEEPTRPPESGAGQESVAVTLDVQVGRSPEVLLQVIGEG